MEFEEQERIKKDARRLIDHRIDQYKNLLLDLTDDDNLKGTTEIKIQQLRNLREEITFI